jgi:Cdc6-like AAA superfamily ATPase
MSNSSFDDPVNEFAHLNLRRWPFDIVPSSEGVQQWIGRSGVSKQLHRLVEGSVRVPNSRIVLVWAAFGSGKTHALRYIEHLADKKDDSVAIYIVVPRGVRSFLDIYKSIVDSILRKRILVPVGQGILRTQGLNVETDAQRAIIRVAIGSAEEQRLVGEWLRADRLSARDVRALGLGRRIETVDDAVQVLSDVVKAIYRHKGPVILLVDEVQELEELGRRLPESTGGLHKLFDLNPRGLTLVFSFTLASRNSVRSILGEALYSRASDIIALPPLSEAEAVDFITELIASWSIDKSRVPFPFTENAIRAVIASLSGEKTDLTPRLLMKAFDHILRNGEYEIADGDLPIINEDYAAAVLNSLPGDDIT